MKNVFHIFAAMVFFLCLSRCGSDPEDLFGPSGDQTIVIVDYTFSPAEVSAAPGESVVFYNLDNTPHRVLSQSTEDSFDDTGRFDSLIIDPETYSAIHIPDDATPGEQIFFYDDFYKDSMTTPSGLVTVE